IIYGVALALIFVLLKISEYKLLLVDHSFELYIGLVALLFLCLGVWIAGKLRKPLKEISVVEKEVLVEKTVYLPQPVEFERNQLMVAAMDLSSRELEVLQLMATGHSNQEIADQLFLSLSTIKTHVSNLYFKMEVTRRTQAIDKAIRLGIIAR
ncbi:MAG: response regulator transcription factor, partial [Chitinophagaceae bacterium]